MNPRYTRLVMACCLAAWWLGGASAVGQQTPDRDFKATVADPAYKDKHPKVLFDEAHFNVHTTQGSYKTFVNLLASDGYQVAANDKPFEAKVLAGHDVLVISNARGAPRPSEKPAFTDAECDAVRDWVQSGGALLLVTDHYPTGHAAENLSKRFGVDMSKGTTIDRAHAPPDAVGGALLFSRDDQLLGDHPITRGRNESERIRRVVTFTGQSLQGPEGSTALLKFSDTAVDRLPSGADSGAGPVGRGRPNARRPMAVAGGDVPTVSAAGRSQGVALKFGQGRVVVLGEASQITAQQAGPQQRPMGMNYPNCDNRQFTLNIMHWLSGLLDEAASKDGAATRRPAEKGASQAPSAAPAEAKPAAQARGEAPRQAPQPEIQLKLRVHCLKSPVPEVNAEPDEAELKKMVEGVNAIWAAAGIRFTLDAVRRDQARDEAAQRELAEMSKQRGREVKGKFAEVMMRVVPEIPLEQGVFHIVLVRRFPLGVGGRYFPELGYLVTPQVVPRPPRMPPGAADGEVNNEHPLEPKVMAHELGHGLTLLHVNLQENLMTVGPGPKDPKTRIKLTDWQIEKARQVAQRGKPLVRGDPLNPHAEEKAAARRAPPGG
jgi:hypothetical protein